MPVTDLSAAELDAQLCEQIPARRLMSINVVGTTIVLNATQNAVATVGGVENTAIVSNSILVGNTFIRL